MLEFLKNLFQSDFMPHGNCYFWRPGIVWLHVLSDGVIALAYFSIPATLGVFARKQRDLPFPWIFLMFGAFILACGTIHIMEVWTVWYGTYRLAGVVKLVTAILSLATAVWLVKLVTAGPALPSPGKLEKLNQNSIDEVSERKRAQSDLEQRVQERTAELVSANAALQAEIEERKRVEGALRESERRFRLLVDRVEDYAIFLMDPEGKVISWNNGAERITGYRAEQVLGRHVSQFCPPEKSEAGMLEADFARVDAQGHYASEEVRLRKNGESYWAHVTTTAVRNEDGTLEGYSRVIRDITERKRAAERFRMAVEAAPNAMIMVDEKGKMNLVNSQTERLFGYDREDLLGRSVEILVPERFRHSHPESRKRFFHQPEARPMGAGRDLYGLRKDGSEVPIEIGLNPFQSSEGPCVLASIIDITERKHAEEVIQASLKEKEALLQEIHHRVKNNMQVVSSLLKLQSGYLQHPQAQNAFRESQDRIRSMAMIHEKLYQSNSRARVDSGDYLRSLVAMLFRSYGSRSAQVRAQVHVAPIPLSISTAIPLGLIAHELVSNCLKYAFPAERAGTVRIELAEETGGWILLTVEDDGIGLPADLDWQNPGTLGLRLMQMFAKQLQGRFDYKAEKGKTAFHFRFQDRPKSSPHERDLAHEQT